MSSFQATCSYSFILSTADWRSSVCRLSSTEGGNCTIERCGGLWGKQQQWLRCYIPKASLCTGTTKHLPRPAREHGKQTLYTIVTTHTYKDIYLWAD